MKPIYEPKGKAKEYGKYALNIYTGCPHRCFYCFAPQVLRRDKEIFHVEIRPRENIVEETRKQLEGGKIKNKTIHLCFTCDPYPAGYDTSVTREIIRILKSYGNHIQILTKGDGSRDLDLLDENDWYGVTIDGSETRETIHKRSVGLINAAALGVKTWISFEPVIDAEKVLDCIRNGGDAIDSIKIGKLNYYPSNINWREFGNKAEALCKELGLNYYIKESLRREMQDET